MLLTLPIHPFVSVRPASRSIGATYTCTARHLEGNATMLRVRTLDLTEFAANSQKWDELWNVSQVHQPTVRAAGIQLWCDSFAPDANFTALVVEDADRWIAGLPLVTSNSRRLFRTQLPTNHTSSAGDFLLDESCDVHQACKLIADELTRQPESFVSFEEIITDTNRWRTLLDAMSASGAVLFLDHQNEVGVIDILDDWEAYQASWSSNHRSVLKRAHKKLIKQGDLTVERLQVPSDELLYETLEQCFEIEDRSWKGANSTSILKVAGLRSYYHCEARLVRDMGALDLWLLKSNDTIIAFEYCHYAKGTCFSHKISFDPDWRKFSPGKLLRRLQLERYHDDPTARLLDTLGLMCESKAKWATRTYGTNRCVAAIGGPVSRLALRALKSAKSLKRILHVNAAPPSPKPGSVGYLQAANERRAVATPALIPIAVCSCEQTRPTTPS